MSDELPELWTHTDLETIATLHPGYGFPKHLQGNAEGDLGFYKVSDISRSLAAGSEYLVQAAHYISIAAAERLRAKPLPKGTVVFARIGEALKLNRRAMLSDEALVDNNVIGIKARPGIEDRYLFYFLKTIRLGDLSQATTVPAVRSSDIAEIEVPVAPTNEQIRIVSKIDELFSRIDEGERALERVQKLVERYRQSVLKAAVSGELTREWREKQAKSGASIETGEALLARILTTRRESWEKTELSKMKAKGVMPKDEKWKQKYAEPSPPDTSKLPDLPEGWVWASMDQLTSKITSGSRDWKEYYGRGESVFVMAQNVRPRRLDLTETQAVDPPVGNRDAERSEVFENDLLVTIVGANTGDVCRVPIPLDRHFVCQSVALARPVLGELSNFIELFMCADEGGQSQFSAVIYGAGRPHLSFDQLRALKIPLPPTEEQGLAFDAVAKIESDIDANRQTIFNSKKSAIALRQSVLKAAFSGQLIEPAISDEPASLLLERIAAERTDTFTTPERGPMNKKKALR